MQGLLWMVVPQGRFIFKTFIMLFFVSITFLFFKENGKKAKELILKLLKQPWQVMFLLCVAYILTCTIMGRYLTRPYKNIFGSFGLFSRDGVINADLCANIIMFVPYTFLYIKAFKPVIPWKACMILSVGTTVAVEFSQLIGWLGNFQIADMLHNIIGGMIGCGIWYIIDRKFISRGWRWVGTKLRVLNKNEKT